MFKTEYATTETSYETGPTITRSTTATQSVTVQNDVPTTITNDVPTTTTILLTSTAVSTLTSTLTEYVGAGATVTSTSTQLVTSTSTTLTSVTRKSGIFAVLHGLRSAPNGYASATAAFHLEPRSMA